MEVTEKSIFKLTTFLMILYFLIVGFIIYKYSEEESQQPKEKPKYETGECYIVGDNWFKIKVTGNFGAIIEDFRYQRKFYITFDELEKKNQFDCDLVEGLVK